jgi:DNA-3-methyladenine glycosylase I
MDAAAKARRDSTRCPWGNGGDPLYASYHDEEWGVPMHDDTRHFEFLVLEAAQAGLSWITILKRREGYRKAYRGFDPARVARFTARDSDRLLADPGIIRNRAKVASSINNARRFLEVQKEFGSFDAYLLKWTDGVQVVNRWKEQKEIPARTELSDAISKDLKARGFSFVGSTIVYSHLQAVGMVNDHLVSCFRWKEVKEAARRRGR